MPALVRDVTHDVAGRTLFTFHLDYPIEQLYAWDIEVERFEPRDPQHAVP